MKFLMEVALFLGDVAFLTSFLIVILKLVRSQSSHGISGKTHIILVMAFVSKYARVDNSWRSIYFAIRNSLFIILSLFILYLIFVKYRKTYEKRFDSYWIETIILPCGAITFIICDSTYDPEMISWIFGNLLECLAIVPQYYFVFLKSLKEYTITYYVMSLTLYRSFYAIHWYNQLMEQQLLDVFIVYPGLIQWSLYIVYFFLPQETKEPDRIGINIRPQFLTQQSLLESPMLKRNATISSSIYLISEDGSSLSRSTGSCDSLSRDNRQRY